MYIIRSLRQFYLIRKFQQQSTQKFFDTFLSSFYLKENNKFENKSSLIIVYNNLSKLNPIKFV